MFANSDYTQPVNAQRDERFPVAWRKPTVASGPAQRQLLP
jgi:hypothetical protein